MFDHLFPPPAPTTGYKNVTITTTNHTISTPAPAAPKLHKLSHSPQNGFRHTLGYVAEYPDGTYDLVLMCVKRGCRDEHGDRLEVNYPLEATTARAMIAAQEIM